MCHLNVNPLPFLFNFPIPNKLPRLLLSEGKYYSVLEKPREREKCGPIWWSGTTLACELHNCYDLQELNPLICSTWQNCRFLFELRMETNFQNEFCLKALQNTKRWRETWLSFNLTRSDVFRNAWYADGRLLLILVTVCVVLPLAMFPKIGKNSRILDFSTRTGLFYFLLLGFSLTYRLPGLHQQPFFHLHTVFCNCGKLWPKHSNKRHLFFFCCWLWIISSLGCGEEMVHSLSSASQWDNTNEHVQGRRLLRPLHTNTHQRRSSTVY